MFDVSIFTFTIIDQCGFYTKSGVLPNHCLQLDGYKSMNVDVESTIIVNYKVSNPHSIA
jgi:hypothetical protein